MGDNVLHHRRGGDGPVGSAPINLTGEPNDDGWITVGYTDRGWMLGVDEDADGAGTIVMGTPIGLWWAPIGTEIPETWPPPAPWRELTAPVND